MLILSMVKYSCLKEVRNMPEIGNPASLLALEEKPNSFVPIDLKSIGLDFPCENLTLRDIDSLNITYSVAEIKEAIKIANVVPTEALNGNLVILYEENGQRRKAPIISKETFNEYNILGMLNDNILDKSFVNQLITKIESLKIPDEIKFSLEEGLRQGLPHLVMRAFNLMGYVDQRRLYLYMIKVIQRGYNKAKRIREKETKEVG